MASPRYDIGDKVYLLESAAIGLLEAVVISGIVKTGDGTWAYSLQTGARSPLPNQAFGDRRGLVVGNVLYFTEVELGTYCDALELAVAAAQLQLQKLQALQTAAACP